MADCEMNERVIENVLTDPEGINPNGNHQAHGNPNSRVSSRVPIIDNGRRRSQFGWKTISI